jgi:branched-chain amino acid transport system ATP-binding protein
MTALLDVSALSCGYGPATVLTDVSLTVHTGEIVAVLGRNGAGKTTLINTIMGLLPPHHGTIHLDGHPIGGAPTWRIARSGVALVPQGRRVFGPLTVAEHLALFKPTAGLWTETAVLELLPSLRHRLRHRGSQLSGGEQQMLALARALLANPRLLLLDEPTEGLAPVVARHIADTIRRLADGGTTIVIAEQNLGIVRAVADRSVVLSGGTVAAGLDLDQLDDVSILTRLLGVQ